MAGKILYRESKQMALGWRSNARAQNGAQEWKGGGTLAYRLAARYPHSPLRAEGGVRHFMFVEARMWSKNSFTSVNAVLMATCHRDNAAQWVKS